MENTIGGSATSTTTPLPAYVGSVDAVNDLLPIYQNSTNGAYSISRNSFLNIASQPVGLTDIQTMTNKTLTTPAISGPTLSGTIIGTYTIGGTPTFPSSVVTLTGSQTLTNKVLTSPTINASTITNATISTDVISGFTTSNSGTLFGSLTAATGNLSTSGTFASGAITSSSNIKANTSNPVWQYLGYAQITGNLTTQSTSVIQATGLTVTVTVPSGYNKVKITLDGGFVAVNTNAKNIFWSIWRGVVGSGTSVSATQFTQLTANYANPLSLIGIDTPAAGSVTYNIGWNTDSGPVTASMGASSNAPVFILVECC